MINSLYEIFGVTSSDVSVSSMAVHATSITACAFIALAVIVAVLLGGLLWKK